MSAVIETIDLTIYGCPMHYIKAREQLRLMELEQEIELIVNNGTAVDDVLMSLRRDGHSCEVKSKDELTSMIKVIKKV
ncbi:MAG: sulfurtransferase TusA family protein [Gammaproteobacteria bacterium]|nr:sulfurtransferase TusA family protein [Gammaproteobacteria bacterium]MDH5592313.1 sulfurtransferase TusA family protein [Gammaproteobacteria bacterium]